MAKDGPFLLENKMKTMIAKWLIYMFWEFINKNGEEEHKRLVVVYEYKGAEVHRIQTGLELKHEQWLRNSMVRQHLDPPGNWDVWRIKRY